MSIFKFRWPYKDDPRKIKNINYNGQPIGTVTDIENTDDGIIVTGEFSQEFTEGPDYKKLFIEPDVGFYSLGPIPANPKNYLEYSAADAELTMSLYQAGREGREQDAYDAAHGWIKPGTRMGCLTVILASLGLWVFIYFVLHWMITGQAFPIFEW